MGYFLNKRSIFDLSDQLRDRGNKVIYTHGTFDLFHAGHSYFLNTSKKRGDILIVGIDSDNKIKKLKNIARPIIPQDQRIELLTNHKAVDFLFLIDEFSNDEESLYVEFYKRIRPNEVTYGRNFLHIDQFFKKENRISGVRYTEIPRVFKNIPSTTDIINKIRGS